METNKFCIDCRHQCKTGFNRYCLHPSALFFDPVEGYYPELCAVVRNPKNDLCGPEGKLFEEKQSIFTILGEILMLKG